jgi:hypothetical protein
LAQINLGGVNIVHLKDNANVQGEIIAKWLDTLFIKIIFRTRRPISIKIGTNYPGVKKIQNCSNKGPGLVQRGR